MNREEKLHIAREAYKALREVIDNLEAYPKADIDCCWNQCISIDGEHFHEWDLSKTDRELALDELVKFSQETGGYGKI